MNTPELETDSQNSFGTKVGDALRIDLYAKVWSEPMVKIAKEFGILDRGAKT